MRKCTLVLLILSMFTLLVSLNLQGSNQLSNYGVPYQTYTLNADGRRIPTQTAYLPVGNFDKALGLYQPEDIFIHENQFYIADTGNKRILVTTSSGQLIHSYEKDIFDQPFGVFVKDQFLYVADKGKREVYQIDLVTEEVVLTIGKPTSPIFGQSNDFVPIKVAVDSSDSIYIVGEGSTSGIIQVNYAGEFVGYLGINTVPLTLRRILYNIFVRDSDVASSLPASPSNIAIGAKGSILTTNVNVRETFKRLNISGVNTLSTQTVYPQIAPSDIYMNEESFIYMVSDNGDIYEYDSNGNMLFYFNTRDTQLNQMLGLTSSPKGIVTDAIGNLYVLDRGYNTVHIYQRTVFVDLVHDAVILYNDGKYIESKPLWEEILKQNSSFALAHSALGQALAKEGRFEEALQSFYDARDYKGYSDTFWEIRNVAIQTHLGKFVLILFGLWIGLKITKKVMVKTQIYEVYLEKKHRFLKQKLTSEVLYAFEVIKRPNDMFYGIKREEKASYTSGSIVFGLFVIVYLINYYATGFLFRNPYPNSILVELSLIFGVFLLYVLVNYLISTLNDGEGRFKDVWIASSYILLPFIIFTLPMTFLSNFLTYNESFIFTFYHQIILVWTIILVIVSIKGVHNYTFFETVKNILIIVFGIFIVILIGLLIYAFLGQLFEFILSIIREVIYRV